MIISVCLSTWWQKTMSSTNWRFVNRLFLTITSVLHHFVLSCWKTYSRVAVNRFGESWRCIYRPSRWPCIMVFGRQQGVIIILNHPNVVCCGLWLNCWSSLALLMRHAREYKKKKIKNSYILRLQILMMTSFSYSTRSEVFLDNLDIIFFLCWCCVGLRIRSVINPIQTRVCRVGQSQVNMYKTDNTITKRRTTRMQAFYQPVWLAW